MIESKFQLKTDELLTELLAEVRALRGDLARREGRTGNLLHVIHDSVKGAEFTAAELVRHAAVPKNIELRAALECEFDDPNSRRIGKLLASIAGRPIGDFIVESIGSEREGIIWRVRVCPGKHTLPIALEN